MVARMGLRMAKTEVPTMTRTWWTAVRLGPFLDTHSNRRPQATARCGRGVAWQHGSRRRQGLICDQTWRMLDARLPGSPL